MKAAEVDEKLHNAQLACSEAKEREAAASAELHSITAELATKKRLAPFGAMCCCLQALPHGRLTCNGTDVTHDTFNVGHNELSSLSINVINAKSCSPELLSNLSKCNTEAMISLP